VYSAPHGCHDVGLGINPRLADCVRDADLLLVVGFQLSEATTFAQSVERELQHRLVFQKPFDGEIGFETTRFSHGGFRQWIHG
jgi:hypothetical protein